MFVLPQYNWGYPAPLKNALEYLYDEWHQVGLDHLSAEIESGSAVLAAGPAALQKASKLLD